MTIARDNRTGEVVGQVTARGELFAERSQFVEVLTKVGYRLIPLRELRLEEVSDD